ncbi:MAG TPA: transglycosylase domain-containing protein [Pseudonocardia sp.]|nr:transglycosylase domain-containing protein [Pseudonocardia sp.]
MAGTAVAALAAPLGVLALGYLAFRLPDPTDAVPQQVAQVSFSDRSQLGQLAAAQPVVVPIERVPTHVRAAVLAAEDRSFYRTSEFEAAITRQYLRQTRPESGNTPWERLTELVGAVKLSQQRSPDEILAGYLNSAYFGRGSYGVQAAARAYFDKDVASLTAGEGALLAGLIDDPAGSDPAVRPDRARQRWDAVLDGMTAEGWLDRGARAALPFPATVPRRFPTGAVADGSSQPVLAAVTAELAELGISDRELNRGGLRVVTTLDPQRQRLAVDAARGPLNGRSGNLRSAMVAIDPNTGGVLAYYGGDDGRGPDYARAPRLAGPTFTPFIVLAGLLHDPPVEPGEPLGTLARRVGPAAVTDAARAAGITPATEHDPRRDQAHGETAVTPYDLASAYATLAAGGIWRPPHLVTTVQDADGRELYRAEPRAEQRFDRNVARRVTQTMVRAADQNGPALPGDRPVAVRTGAVAANDRDDAWTVGFTPDLAASVWMGTDPTAPVFSDDASGSASRGTSAPGSAAPRSAASGSADPALLPGRAWREFMTDALSERPVRAFDPPEPVQPAPSDPTTSRPIPTPDPASDASPTRPTKPTPTPTETPDPSTEPADPTDPTDDDDQTDEPTEDPTGESSTEPAVEATDDPDPPTPDGADGWD